MSAVEASLTAQQYRSFIMSQSDQCSVQLLVRRCSIPIGRGAGDPTRPDRGCKESKLMKKTFKFGSANYITDHALGVTPCSSYTTGVPCSFWAQMLLFCGHLYPLSLEIFNISYATMFIQVSKYNSGIKI